MTEITQNSGKKLFSGMTKFYVAFILLVVAMVLFPPIGITPFAITMATVAVGGLIADTVLNRDSKKLLEQKHAGMSKIASKYNEQVRDLNSEYEREKKTLQLVGNLNKRSLKRTFSTRYETLQKQYANELNGFVSFWKTTETKRFKLFRLFWAWLLIIGFAGAFYCYGSELNELENGSQVASSEEKIYWNAENIPLPHLTDGSQYVSNPDNVLSESTVSRINETMLQLDNEFGIESAVIVVNHIENDDPFRMAQDVGNRYGVGRNDLGLVIVVGYEDHSINMSPGRSLEAHLTDAECHRLEQRYVVPAMRAEMPDSAMLYLADGLYAFMKDKPMPEMALPRSVGDDSMTLGLYFWFLVGWLILTVIMERKYEWLSIYGVGTLASNPFIETPVYVSTGGSGFGSSGSRGGFGGGGFGGGFGGGYGGGSFGGGGATSRW
ncbi:MAG: TPM domain-containing protein [Prevotella sp.]|nr:TPM domain-containing protein [Prevotella sp.]